jgi:hypothetical protein
MTDADGKCPQCGAPLEPDRTACASCGSRIDTQATTVTQREPGSSQEPAPKQLGDFSVVGTIGRGGMGTVYKAYQESMRRDVALKVLDAGLFPTDEQVQRFEREAWIAGRLSHPNIVKVYGQGEAGDSRYIAMELVEGPSLHAELKRLRGEKSAASLDPSYMRRIVELFLDVADALSYVHEQGIIHRDIKPLNLLFTKDRSRILLSDFGMARDEETTRLTRRGDFMGTVRYMSPEQLLAHRTTVDHRSDIWSLGISIYEAVTLQLPFSADTEEGYISAIGMKEPLPARHHNRVVPRELETVLMKCLERDPERRYRSAAELRDDLKRFLDGIPVLARRPSILRRGRSWARGHLGVIAAVLFIALILSGAVSVRIAMQQGRAAREKQRREAIQQRLHDVGEYGKTIARLRDTLEMIIDAGEEPFDLPAEWDRLFRLLRVELAKEPRGDLAVLALRALARMEITLTEFGTLADPPDLKFHFDPHFELAFEYLVIVDLETSWDDGSWMPLGSCLIEQRGEMTPLSHGGATLPLSKLVPRGRLTAGPHHLEFKASYHFLEPSGALIGSIPGKIDANGIDLRRCEPLRIETTWPAARAKTELHMETRVLPSLATNLYEQFPADFPRARRIEQFEGSPESWLSFETMRFIRAQIPEGRGNALEIVLPEGSCFDEEIVLCLPGAEIPSPSESVVACELRGEFSRDLPVPIAASVKARTVDEANLLASMNVTIKPKAGIFNNTLGDFVCYEHGQHVRLFLYGCKILEESRSGRYMEGDYQHHLKIHDEPPADGIVSGTLEFLPSRSLALDTKMFSEYLAEPFSIPLEFEIITVPASWIDEEKCADR